MEISIKITAVCDLKDAAVDHLNMTLLSIGIGMNGWLWSLYNNNLLSDLNYFLGLYVAANPHLSAQPQMRTSHSSAVAAPLMT